MVETPRRDLGSVALSGVLPKHAARRDCSSPAETTMARAPILYRRRHRAEPKVSGLSPYPIEHMFDGTQILRQVLELTTLAVCLQV